MYHIKSIGGGRIKASEKKARPYKGEKIGNLAGKGESGDGGGGPRNGHPIVEPDSPAM